MFVLDATVMRAGMSIDGFHEWFTTPSVKGELEKGKVARDLEILENIHLKVMAPRHEFLEKIRRAAEKTGDIARLSDTDMEVLALALELGATIISDDYSIQNVAQSMKIEYRSGVEPGIKKIFNWTFRCTGCGRYFEKKYDSCEICGSALKTVRK